MIINDKEEYAKKLKLFNFVLQNIDENLHRVDVIDYYEIVGEKVSTDLYTYRKLMGNHYSFLFDDFVRKNTMIKELTFEELLNPNNGYGVEIENNRYFATEEDLIEIYKQLTERKIPVFQRTVTAQLSRNWEVNTDYHYPDLPLIEEKTKKLTK